MSNKVVVFLVSNGIYNAGDIAGFAPNEAERLVGGGVAKYHEPSVDRSVEVSKDSVEPPKPRKKRRVKRPAE